jgi:hypothetical protein
MGKRHGRTHGRTQIRTPTAKDFTVVDGGEGSSKVTINAVIPTPTYPNDSKNMGLRKGHEKITDSKVVMLMNRLHLDLF